MDNQTPYEPAVSGLLDDIAFYRGERVPVYACSLFELWGRGLGEHPTPLKH